MANRDKQEKYILLKSEHPEMEDVEVCRQAGYSEKRLHVTAGELRRNSRVQARIAAIRNQRLSAAPTKEAFYALLNSAAEAALRESNSKSSWILLRCAELMGQELSTQHPQSAVPVPVAVMVKFVDSPLPEAEVAAINKSAAEFEAQIGAPGFMGRLRSVEAVSPEPPRLVEPKVKVEPAPKEDLWFHCERGHGKYWNVASCPSCDAISWQEQAMAKARAAVN